MVKPFANIIPNGTIPLGFGCGGLRGGKSRRDSLRLLETAIDCGITYFDTARMYGLGAAEGLLGKVASRNRDRMIIASKAGILPANRSVPMRLANRGIKLLHKSIPNSERYLPVPAGAQLRYHAFSLSALRKSVETSLEQLQTDYLDVLLLHECSASDVENPQVFGFLQDLKREGKIRAFGLATGIDETIQIMATRPPLSRVVQIPSSILDMNIKLLPPRANGLTIVHSCLTARLCPLLTRLSSNHNLAKKWANIMRIDLRDTTSIVQLLLAHALHSNPGGLVLFSSSNPTNIRFNVRVATDSIIDTEQIEEFNLLIAEAKALSQLTNPELDRGDDPAIPMKSQQ